MPISPPSRVHALPGLAIAESSRPRPAPGRTALALVAAVALGACAPEPARAPDAGLADAGEGPRYTLSLEAPAEAVDGPVTVVARTSDEAATERVEFRLDEQEAAFETDRSAPFALTLQPEDAEGRHRILATAVRSDGARAVATVEVAIDTLAPHVSVRSPRAGQLVLPPGEVVFNVLVRDDSAVAGRVGVRGSEAEVALEGGGVTLLLLAPPEEFPVERVIDWALSDSLGHGAAGEIPVLYSHARHTLTLSSPQVPIVAGLEQARFLVADLERVRVLNAAGDENWSLALSGTERVVEARGLATGAALLVLSQEGADGKRWSLRSLAADGTAAWTRPADPSSEVYGAILVEQDGRSFAVKFDPAQPGSQRVVAIGVDGSELPFAALEPGFLGRALQRVCAADGACGLAVREADSASSAPDRLTVFDADGARLRTLEFPPQTTVESFAAATAEVALLVAQEEGESSSRLLAIDEQGERWTLAPEEGEVFGELRVEDGALALASALGGAGRLRRIRLDGSVAFDLRFESPVVDWEPAGAGLAVGLAGEVRWYGADGAPQAAWSLPSADSARLTDLHAGLGGAILALGTGAGESRVWSLEAGAEQWRQRFAEDGADRFRPVITGDLLFLQVGAPGLDGRRPIVLHSIVP